jgi:hypothetical protein
VANQEEMHVQEEEFVEYDPEVQIYPGGPTQGEVETWKARFGEVFATEGRSPRMRGKPLLNRVFYWRSTLYFVPL